MCNRKPSMQWFVDMWRFFPFLFWGDWWHTSLSLVLWLYSVNRGPVLFLACTFLASLSMWLSFFHAFDMSATTFLSPKERVKLDKCVCELYLSAFYQNSVLFLEAWSSEPLLASLAKTGSRVPLPARESRLVNLCNWTCCQLKTQLDLPRTWKGRHCWWLPWSLSGSLVAPSLPPGQCSFSHSVSLSLFSLGGGS